MYCSTRSKLKLIIYCNGSPLSSVLERVLYKCLVSLVLRIRLQTCFPSFLFILHFFWGIKQIVFSRFLLPKGFFVLFC